MTGLDGIAITDHDAIGASLRAAELAPAYGLVALPGVEVSTADGHLLALGVEQRPVPYRPLAETVARVRTLGGVPVVPHPFQLSRHSVGRRNVADLEDSVGMEVYNAWSLLDVRNRRARQFATERGYPLLGGSDAHVPAVVGRAYTEVVVEIDAASTNAVDRETFLDAILVGETRSRGVRMPMRRYVRKYAESVRRKTNSALGALVGSRRGRRA